MSKDFEILIYFLVFHSKMLTMILREIFLINVICYQQKNKYLITLIDSKPIFDKPVKSKQEAQEKSSKCQEIMTIKQEIY